MTKLIKENEYRKIEKTPDFADLDEEQYQNLIRQMKSYKLAVSQMVVNLLNQQENEDTNQGCLNIYSALEQTLIDLKSRNERRKDTIDIQLIADCMMAGIRSDERKLNIDRINNS